MELIFLGTGTSQGVPMIAHDPPDLDLSDPRNHRTRTSIHVVMGGMHLQVDCAPEFRVQCLANDLRRVEGVLLTHAHADHIMGMDDLRRFVDLNDGEAMPVWGDAGTLERVRAIYPYAIRDKPQYKGYPAFQLSELAGPVQLPGGTVEATVLPHGHSDVLGLVFTEAVSERRLVYYTDCKDVPPDALELARGADVAVLDALRHEPHYSHMHTARALEVAAEIGARQTFFTHMTWGIDQARDSANLPPHVAYAHDGLRVTI